MSFYEHFLLQLIAQEDLSKEINCILYLQYIKIWVKEVYYTFQGNLQLPLIKLMQRNLQLPLIKLMQRNFPWSMIKCT